MTFELFPVLNIMRGLYSQPLGIERFQNYIKILEGNTKGDLSVPVSGYNPMAKWHVAEQVDQLIDIDAEGIVSETLAELRDCLKIYLQHKPLTISSLC